MSERNLKLWFVLMRLQMMKSTHVIGAAKRAALRMNWRVSLYSHEYFCFVGNSVRNVEGGCRVSRPFP